MLSRVAESVYWAARYLERVENVARLVRSYNHLIMDIPVGSEPSWSVLVDILEAKGQFYKIFRKETEKNVHSLLMGKEHASCSIPFSINQARENVRITRDVFPEEAWEHINELHLYTIGNRSAATSRRNRLLYLEEIIQTCRAFAGLMHSSASRDNTYGFYKLGQFIERADMTARIVNVGAGDVLDREGEFFAIDPLLWGALLQALSGRSAYRREIGPIVDKDSFIDFVFKSRNFPRSVFFCLNELRRYIGLLPGGDDTVNSVDRIRRRLRRFNSDRKSREGLNLFIDGLQSSLIMLDDDFRACWFQRSIS